MIAFSRAVLLVLAVLMTIAGAGAQSPEPDPAAMKAFEELVSSYRARPALTVKSTVKIELMEGDVKASGSEKKAEFVFGPKKSAVVKLNGYTCYLKDGKLTAVHEKTDHSYFTMEDDGSPYYALMTAFVDIPFPELAIMLGEDAIDDICMQLHPKAPYVKPTKVAAEQKDGKQLQHITLTSDLEVLDVWVDPESKLIQSIELSLTGGDQVQAGATLSYKHTYEYETHDKPLDETVFSFDPGQRQRVDMLAALAPKPEPAEVDGEGDPGGQGALVGKAAPPLVLATADGKAIDLEDLKGRVVVLDFWATWCGPCKAALPLLHDVARWASQEELPVTVITVNVWESRDPAQDNPDARLRSVKDFWDQQKFTLPVAMDYTDETAKAYGVAGIPATFIIRSDGVVHAQHSGAGGNYAETLKQEIQDALKAIEAGM